MSVSLGASPGSRDWPTSPNGPRSSARGFPIAHALTREEPTRPPSPLAAFLSPRRRRPRVPRSETRSSFRGETEIASFVPRAAFLYAHPNTPLLRVTAQNPARPLVCAPCTATALRARRWTLERLRGAHERARADLASALRRGEGARDEKNACPGDARDCERLRARLDARRSRLTELRASVAAARDDATRRAAANASRAAALRESSRRLEQRRAELFSLAGAFSERRRALATRAKAAEDAFAREACFALADLKTLVPVAAERPDPETARRASASKRGEKPLAGRASRLRKTPPPETAPEDGVPTAVRVCGFRAPDPGDVAEFRAEELSAGLGALLLFAETASRALGAARLARGDGAGSSRARVWVPASYFEEDGEDAEARCRAGARKLPLFLPRDVVEANGGGPDAAREADRDVIRTRVSLGARVAGTVAGIAATGATAAAALAANVADGARFASGGARDVAAASGGAQDPSDPAVLARHRAELYRAVATLHRHAGATCVELEHVLGDVRAPEKWGPFASLAFLVTEGSRRARDAREDARRAAEAAEAADLDADARGERARSNPFFDDEEDDEEEEVASTASEAAASRRRMGARPRGDASLLTSVFGGAFGRVPVLDGASRAKRGASRGGNASRDGAFGAATVADLAADGWDLVEHPVHGAENSRRRAFQSAKESAAAPVMLPPPPSAPEDVEHWTRAMYVDARK